MADLDVKVRTTFYAAMGMFHVAWSTTDVVTSYGIGLFLKISDEQAHILTAGMEFGRKASLLRNLVTRSAHRNRRAILGALSRLQNDSKRNVIAHGIVFNGVRHVRFLDRSRGGDYRVTPCEFTYAEFTTHVGKFLLAAKELESALELDKLRYQEFLLAAASADKSARKSPTPPSSKVE